jgi:hypothetical protein
MPAIDPAALRARTALLAERVYDPPALAAGVRALLDDYADRAHRVSPRLTGSAPSNSFKTPAPVARAIVSALRGFAKTSPHAALDMVKAIWAGGSREERRVAAELLGCAAPLIPDIALALIENWLPGLESGETADALAEHGLGPLMLADPALHLPNARRWAQSYHKWTRRFGLSALKPLLRDKAWDNVPGALEVVRSVMADPEPEVRAAASAVLRDLIPKSPVEAGRFLREQAERGDHNTHFIIRATLASLAPVAQTEINRIMRS